MADFTADFEAGVNGAAITTGAGEASATAWTSVDGDPEPTYSNAQAFDGSLSALIDANDWMRWSSSATDHYGRLYVYLTSDNAGGFTTIFDLEDSSVWFSIAIWTDRKWYLGGVNNAGATIIPLNQWVRIEYHIVHHTSAGSYEARLYLDPASNTADETLSASSLNSQTQAGQIRFGSNIYNGFSSGYHLDAIVANATDWVGPIGSSQTLLASADSVDGAWTDQAGGTSLSAAIDEATFNDADYIRSELNPSTSGCRIKLAAGGDPHISTGHVINWRTGKIGSATINMTVKLYQGGGNSLGAGTLIATFNRNNVGALTTYQETLSGGEADSITDYTDLYLEFFADTA